VEFVLDLGLCTCSAVSGYFEYAPAVVGAFKCASDIQEVANVKSYHFSVLVNNGFVSYNPIFKTFPTFFIVACNYYVCCRCFRYGFRASLVSFSGLLAMVIALPFKRNSL
jgi:hypothetical protein